MAWTDSPTPLQLGALRKMSKNLKRRFDIRTIDAVLLTIKDRREASEALESIRAIRVHENTGYYSPRNRRLLDEAIANSKFYQQLINADKALFDE